MKSKDKDKLSIADKMSIGRRKLLKSVVAGGGALTVAKTLPDQWARPVVDSVMLPAHAQASVSSFGPFFSFGPFVMTEPSVQMVEQGFSEELLEFFTPAAQAGVPSNPDAITFTANSSGNSFLCAISNVVTEMTTVQMQNTTPPSFIGGGSTCLYGAQIQSGQFIQGTGWEVTVLPPGDNVTTTVILMPGGTGCSSGKPGICV